jgi:hypothetical protein
MDSSGPYASVQTTSPVISLEAFHVSIRARGLGSGYLLLSPGDTMDSIRLLPSCFRAPPLHSLPLLPSIAHR